MEEYITDFEELKAKYDELQDRYKNCRAERDGLEAQVDGLNVALNDARSETPELTQSENELNYTIADLRHQLKRSEETGDAILKANVNLHHEIESVRKLWKKAVKYGNEMEEAYASQGATPVSLIEEQLRERAEDADNNCRVNALALEKALELYDAEKATSADFHAERDEAIKELEEARDLADERWKGYKRAIADRDAARAEGKRLRKRIAELEDLVAGHQRSIEEQRALANERWKLWQQAAGELDQLKKAQAENPDVVAVEYGNDAY